MSEGIVMKSDGTKTLAQMQAEVAAFEANPIAPNAPEPSTVPASIAAAPVTPPEKAALPEPVKTPPVEEQAKPAQKPQETVEKAATEPPKAAEPVKDWKAAYEGLQRKYNQRFQEEKAKATAPEKPAVAAPAPEIASLDLTPEVEQKILADLDKAPVKTLVSLMREIARGEVNPVKSKLEASDFEKNEAAKLAGLDKLANEGHDWLKTEDGLRKMETALNENPELWKSKDPYRAALGFIPDIPSKAGQRSPAQTTGLTPILGVSGAVPPTVSTPAVSKVDVLAQKLSEVQRLQGIGTQQAMTEANRLLAEMERIERGY